MKRLLAVFFFIVPALRAMDGAGAMQDTSESDAAERKRVELLYPHVGEVRRGTELTFHMVCSVPEQSSDHFRLLFTSQTYRRSDRKKIKKQVPQVGDEREQKRRVLYNCPLAHLCQVRERLDSNQVVLTQEQLDELEYLAKSAELFGKDKEYIDALFIYAPHEPASEAESVAGAAVPPATRRSSFLRTASSRLLRR